MKAWLVGFTIVGAAWMMGGRPAASAADTSPPQADTPAGTKAALAGIERSTARSSATTPIRSSPSICSSAQATNADVEQLVHACRTW